MKVLYLTIGWVSLALGAIGAFIPILPTTPFLILAAFCFSRSSPKMKAWLLNSPLFGPSLRDWEDEGVIRTKPKFVAAIMISLSALFLLSRDRPSLLIKIPVVMLLGCIIVFIFTRPSKPRKEPGA